MKITVIGSGVMGSSFAKQFAKKHQVIVYDRTREKATALAKEIGVKATDNIQEAVQGADAILLAVKPKDLGKVSKEIGSSLSGKQLVLSILTGTSLETLKKHFPSALVVRLMPNLALTCGEGVIAVAQEEILTGEVKKRVEELLGDLGLLIWLAEHKMEGLTALAGSGPAFVCVFIEAMIEAGIAMGLSAKESEELTLKTMEGAIALVRSSDKHPGAIRWQISSPGGTTIAGLNEMEVCGVRSGIIRTFLAAYKRSKEFL